MTRATTCLCLGAYLATAIAGCLLEDTGTLNVPASSENPPPTGGSGGGTGPSSSSSSGNTTSSSSSGNTTSSSSSGNTSSSSSGQGGSGGGGPPTIYPTCMDILTNNPQAPSGIYTIDPDEAGSKDPFQVECKMIGTNGWTLVGLEKPNSSENLKFLGVEKGTPADLIAKNNALIGTRFRGLYTAVRIEWDTTRYVEFIKNGAEIFDDTVDVAISIKSVTSSEGNFNTWISGGAKLCRATSQSGSKMPGDSSWALKPSNDNFIQCGCNSGMWKGQGLYYSGTGSQCTSCGCSTGGFVGAKDTNDMKSGVVSWETRIYVL